MRISIDSKPSHSFIRFARVSLVLVALCAFVAGADQPMPGDLTKAPSNAVVEIIAPLDGATVTSPVTVKFGLGGMGVAPAGIDAKDTGHHHLIIDAPLPDMRFAVPQDNHYRHFGGGQTQVTVDLEPGTHTLQLLLADHRHIPHQPPVVSKKITITVE